MICCVWDGWPACGWGQREGSSFGLFRRLGVQTPRKGLMLRGSLNHGLRTVISQHRARLCRGPRSIIQQTLRVLTSPRVFDEINHPEPQASMYTTGQSHRTAGLLQIFKLLRVKDPRTQTEPRLVTCYYPVEVDTYLRPQLPTAWWSLSSLPLQKRAPSLKLLADGVTDIWKVQCRSSIATGRTTRQSNVQTLGS